MHVQCNDIVTRPNLHFVHCSRQLLNYHYSKSGIFPRTFHKEIVCHLVDYTAFLLRSRNFWPVTKLSNRNRVITFDSHLIAVITVKWPSYEDYKANIRVFELRRSLWTLPCPHSLRLKSLGTKLSYCDTLQQSYLTHIPTLDMSHGLEPAVFNVWYFKMATSKSANTYNRQNWENSVWKLHEYVF